MPTASGRTWRTEFQNASVVCPDSVRPGSVGDRAGNDDREAPARRGRRYDLEREQRGLAVQRVEDRLDEEEVGAAFGEALDRFAVRRDELVEADIARTGIVDVGRDRRRAVRRPERAGDEARLAGRARGPGVGALAGEPCRGGVDVAHAAAARPIVGLRDRRRVERIGAHDVGAGLEIGVVDRADDIGLRQREEIVVALDVVVVAGEGTSRGNRPRPAGSSGSSCPSRHP